MQKELNYFLFKMEVLINGEKNKRSFFKFQSSLAEALVNSPGHYYNNKAENLRPYINQVLKPGDVDSEKPMSEKLKAQILKLLKKRLSPKDPLFSNLELEFSKAYDLLKKKNTEKKIINNDFEEFSIWGLKANKIVSMIDRPGEASWSIESDRRSDADYVLNNFFQLILRNFKGNEKEILSDLSVKNLQLKPNINNNNSYTYKFFVPTYSIGIEIWQKIFHFFFEEKLSHFDFDNNKKANITSYFLENVNFFKPLTESKSMSFINVYKIDPQYTAVPLVYFQSKKGVIIKDGIKSHEETFVINLHENIITKALKLAPSSMRSWKESVYFYLNNNLDENKLGIEEIRFSDYEFDIVNLLDFQKK